MPLARNAFDRHSIDFQKAREILFGFVTQLFYNHIALLCGKKKGKPYKDIKGSLSLIFPYMSYMVKK